MKFGIWDLSSLQFYIMVLTSLRGMLFEYN